VLVPPERVAGWVERFAARHGGAEEPPLGHSAAPDATDDAVSDGPAGIVLVAPDGARAVLRLPWRARDGRPAGPDLAAFVAAAVRPEVVGLLVIRRGGFTVGVAEGTRIVGHRTGSRYVQGRTAAGGWSQQRYTRRRSAQASAALAQAAGAVTDIVLPYESRLAVLVAGGDRDAVVTVLRAARLRPLMRLLRPALVAVGDPRRVALDAVLADARAITIDVTDPTG